MKKIMFSIIALTGMISFASCKKELQEIKQEEQVSPETVQLSITASIPESKTLIAIENNAYVPKWTEGDKLGVFLGDFDASATAVSAELSGSTTDGGETATFTGSAPSAMGEQTVYAFYPARAFYATESNLIVDLEIPYIQFPTETSFDPKADLLVSVPQKINIVKDENTVNNMQFRRIGAILKVDLVDGTGLLASDKIKSVKLESKAGKALTGAFCYDFTKEDAASTQINAPKNHVTADFSLNPVTWGTSVYFIVNPTTLDSGTELVVTVLTDNHRVEKTIPLSGDMVFESSTVKKIRVTFNDASAVERVYFQDNFDWTYKFWDEECTNAYGKSIVITDPVDNDAAAHSQPNVWGKYSSSIGTAFNTLGYKDLDKEASGANNVLYIQENYIKIGAGNKQTALQLPQIAFGNIPINVTLRFKWCRHMATSGNIDDVPLVVEILNQGKCADSGTTTSNVFSTSQEKSNLYWTEASVTLKGVTSSTRIVLKENYDSYKQSGNHRFHLDDIKITEAEPTPTEFPVVWSFPEPGDNWVEDIDYHMQAGSGNGSYVYSDNHTGKLFTYRTSSNQYITTTDSNTGKVTVHTPTYLKRTDTIKDTDGTDLTGEVMFLHYGIGKNDYWEFDVFNVKNEAGEYNVSFKMCSSNSGAKHFRIEYTLDDQWPSTPLVAASDSGDGTTEDNIYYSYATPSNNYAVQANAHFHLDSMTEFKTLRIRAIVVTNTRCNGTGNLSNNTTATNRMFGTPTISFTAD